MIIDLHLFLSRYCLHRACWTWLDKNYNANQGSMCSVNVFEPTKYRKLMGFYWISQVIDIWMIFGWSSFIYTVYIYIYLDGRPCWQVAGHEDLHWPQLRVCPAFWRAPPWMEGLWMVVDGCGWWHIPFTVFIHGKTREHDVFECFVCIYCNVM